MVTSFVAYGCTNRLKKGSGFTFHLVGNEQKGKYPPELRAFALTLHFYSPAAYEYVRSKFNEALPSQRTLRGWYKSIQGAPGFTAEAFAFLEKFAEARDEPFYCALIVDDMAIRKHVELVGDKVGMLTLELGLTMTVFLKLQMRVSS
ncbi:hypothetical protein MRX96_003418 [Rhipicephalus microplus]